MPASPTGRAAELIATLKLLPHPEGGFYRETFRSAQRVETADGRGARSALTHIDFLLARGQFSAWHRVASDELWHLLEGGPLRLWLIPPSMDRIECVDLGSVDATTAPRLAVPAAWWQAAEALGDYAYIGATVAPGFEFADFTFLRERAEAAALDRLAPALTRLL